MKVEICKWYQDSLAPVIFMVDDFCNVWVDTNGNGRVDLGEDWGYAKRGLGSSLVFLEDGILKNFPGAKVTFFTPVGIRAGVIENPTVSFVSKRINCDLESIAFFKSVGDDPRYEIAYHGTTHGTPGKETKDFIQEWDKFSSLDQAKDAIRVGKEIFRDVFGVDPAGGKYCGYVSNRFSDDSIDQSGFRWWCRYSNVGLYDYPNCTFCGQDFNPLTNFDIKYFGKNNVVDIPTTLNVSTLTRILHPEAYDLKGILKRLLKPLLIKAKLRKIDFLLQNHLVVCIQEHIAPSRVDDRRQLPNIFDDFDSLQLILAHLKQRNVWYCTCSELAQYVVARDTAVIEVCADNRFNIHLDYPGPEGATLTLKFDRVSRKIIQPDGIEVTVHNQLASVKIMKGQYVLI